MKSFWKRTITGLIFVVVMLSSLLHPYLFIIVFMWAHVLCLLEYQSLLDKQQKAGPFLSLFIPGILLHGWVLFVSANQLNPLILVPALLLLFVPWFPELFPSQRQGKNIRWLQVAGLTAISAPLSLLAVVVYQDGFNPSFLLGLFLLVWICDTGAYLAGSLTGKNKIWPAVSPAKSWEGLAGGILLTLIAAWIMHIHLPVFSLELWLITALLVGLMTNFGDFTESWLKRRAGVKDSGNLLPGHGGVLDRFDGFLFATPIYVLMLEIFKL